jgi:proteasome lid subunit RPN8/RPN11/cell division protein FtsB
MPEIPNVEPRVLDAVNEHGRTATTGPVGGILLGWIDGDVLSVERAVPAVEPDLHGGELVFTPPSWEAAYAELERSGPDARIVGWYHAHPSHGAALSDYDRSLHRTLFSDPSQVALVVDPHSGEVAWFGWGVERIGPLGDQAEAGAGEGEAVPMVVAGRPRRRVVGELVIAVVLAAAIVGAYLWGHSLTETRTVTRGVAASSGQLEQARAEVSRLRAQLAVQAAQAADVQARLEATKDRLEKATKKLTSGTGSKPTKGSFVFLYRVQPGDSMASLSQMFYGSWRQWAKIWHANPVRDPDRILIGSVLKIPLRSA